MRAKLTALLSKPVDIAFLAYFRIAAGLFICFELVNQFFTGDIENYTEPGFHFTYQFFPWLQTYPAFLPWIVFVLVIVSSLCVALGWRYRFFSILLFLSYSLLFLMEKSEYVNHFYLYCLVALMMAILPANRALALDVKRSKVRSTQVPAWMYYILIFHISVVYFYGGLAKLHSDWFQARAMLQWVEYGPEFKLLGSVLINDYTPWVLSYGGIFFDLLIVPALLWKRTRTVAFIIACCFHLTNVTFFGLATFPWFSIMMTTLFFGPSFPRKFRTYSMLESKSAQVENHLKQLEGARLNLLLTYCLLHLLIPLRHHLYPGESIWTEEGHRFSWHMMLRGKQPYTAFTVVTPDTTIYEDGKRFLSHHQYYKMSYDPDMILEYAHFLRDDYKKRGFNDVEIYVRSMVSLNGRPSRPFIDPKKDLAKEERSWRHYDWIMPFPLD